MIPIESFDELRSGEDLLITRRPAETHQIIEHSVGRVTFIPVLGDADRSVPFAQLFALGRQHHGQMGKLWRLPPERFIEQHLLWGVADVIAPPSDERDAHLVVVDDRRQIVER